MDPINTLMLASACAASAGAAIAAFTRLRIAVLALVLGSAVDLALVMWVAHKYGDVYNNQLLEATIVHVVIPILPGLAVILTRAEFNEDPVHRVRWLLAGVLVLLVALFGIAVEGFGVGCMINPKCG